MHDYIIFSTTGPHDGDVNPVIVGTGSSTETVTTLTDPSDTSGGVLSAADIVARRRDGCHRSSDDDDDIRDDCVPQSVSYSSY